MPSAEEFLGTPKVSAAEFLGGATSAPAEQPGILQRFWNGLTGKDVSRAGRFGMGVADLLYGGAQIGARMGPEIGGAAFEPPEETRQRVQSVDRAVAERETRYQNREKAAGLSGGFGSEWARLLGNAAAEAPLAAVPGAGATLPARMGLGAAAGAAGGASLPVAGGSFGRQKLAQAVLGAAGGAAGQGVSEIAGALAHRLGQAMRPANAAPRPPQPIAPAVQNQVQQQFQQAAPMSPAGVRGAPDIATQQANRVSAIQSIVADRPNLTFDTPKGIVSGRLPENRAELADAVSQTKTRLFQKWDQMTRETDTGLNPEASTIGKHKQAWAEAQSRIAEAGQNLREANTAYTLAKAQQTSAGNNVYRSNAANAAERSARADVQKATWQLELANRTAEIARADLRKPWVDLKPIAAELQRFADDDGLKLTPGSEGVVNYAKQQAAKYAEEEAGSPRAVQQAITKANASLESFYKNPSYESAARAGVDAMVANQLRRGLDQTIAKVTGPGYQQLKLQYGALSAIEKDTARAAVRALGNSPDARFIEGLTGVGSTEELLRGLASLRLEPIMRGVMIRAARELNRIYNSPDRAVQQMFRAAERNQRIGQAGFAGPALAGALAGESAVQDRPRVGSRGPYGGTITGTSTIRRDIPEAAGATP